MNRHECTVETVTPVRVDKYVAEDIGLLKRSQLKARGARFFVGGREVKPSRSVSGGDRLIVEWEDEPSHAFIAEDLPLSILYEDEAVIVVDKAQGMVTHPGHGNWSGTLANALMGRLSNGSADRPPNPQRAGIVHRLDKDTSGVIICAKNANAQEALATQFRDRTTVKEYLAIVRGRLPTPDGRIDNYLVRDPADRKRFAVSAQECGGRPQSGRHAVTFWKTIAVFASGSSHAGDAVYTFVSLKPKTGRTHQLRVHLKALGCPIVGDPIYGRRDERFPAATLMLHAFKLKIRLPGAEVPSLFKAQVPDRFRAMLAVLRRS